MKYLKIQNKGELDIRLVALMGGTTKANDLYKIGQFGTGLKYTLAYLFRNNIDFKIFSGANKVDVSTEIEMIGQSEFEIICINGNRTSITTGMGGQWTAWMIIRELWCNALDEGEQLKDTVNDNYILGEEGKTTFFIQITPEIQSVIDDWKKYFIQGLEPLWNNESYAIYENYKNEKLCLYKNGVLIYQHPHIKSLFCYDIKGAEINELREFKGIVSYEILRALEKPSKEVVSYFFNNVTKEHYEGSELDYDWFTQFADIWREALGGRKVISEGGYTHYEERGIVVDYTNVIELPKKIYQALTKQFEGIGALAVSDNNTDFYEAETIDLRNKVNLCIDILNGSGYSLFENCIIKLGFFQEKTLHVSANRDKKHMLISESSKLLTDEELCSLIIEHNEYLKTNYKKDNRNYTKHFIDLYTKSIMSKNLV